MVEEVLPPSYRQEEKVAPLVRQLPSSHKKRPEERAFYLQLGVAEGWSRRELGSGLEASR
jgi:hypothetical protein